MATIAARPVLVEAVGVEPQGDALGSGAVRVFVLVAYRLLAPGSEWRLHREWFQRSALADLLGEDAGLVEIHKLYRCHDRLLAHKQAVFDHLTARWRDLFNISSGPDQLREGIGDPRRIGDLRRLRPKRECIAQAAPRFNRLRGL
jgi:hypothetical protein